MLQVTWTAGQSIESLTNNRIAFAGLGFETRPIQYFHGAAGVPNEASLLKLCLRHRHGSPANTEHFREKLLRNREGVAVDAVVSHEEPTRATLLDRMKPIAGCCLRHLDEHRNRVRAEHPAELCTSRKVLIESIAGHTERLAWHLDKKPGRRRAKPEERRYIGHTFISNRGELNCPARSEDCQH